MTAAVNPSSVREAVVLVVAAAQPHSLTALGISSKVMERWPDRWTFNTIFNDVFQAAVVGDLVKDRRHKLYSLPPAKEAEEPCGCRPADADNAELVPCEKHAAEMYAKPARVTETAGRRTRIIVDGSGLRHVERDIQPLMPITITLPVRVGDTEVVLYATVNAFDTRPPNVEQLRHAVVEIIARLQP